MTTKEHNIEAGEHNIEAHVYNDFLDVLVNLEVLGEAMVFWRCYADEEE
ncbi:hypothetical protein KAR91_52355 [Candidatus Pacearchaeota archaeon]|nr:hypothetical protein [Candidatus Pacearchaeota archaeon]